MKLIDGTAIAKEIEQKIQKEISELTGRKPGL
jgi:5,10-methylene-tetrahydrofolate dehydrogenase/methenyl tetrahydrofolate cyclohydrolase